MIEQFRRLNPVNISLLVLISLILRTGLFLQLPESLPLSIFEPLGKLLISIPEEAALSPVFNILVAALLVIIQALWVNKLVNDHNLIGKPSFVPALLFVTASSLLTPFLTLSQPLFANFFIIWMTKGFLSIYRKDEVRSVTFNMGMIAAIGTLIYFPFIAMMPLVWVSLLLFRPFNWREWLSGFLGFVTIYFFLGFFYYWNDSTDLFYQLWLPFRNKFVFGLKITLYDYIILVPVAFIFALSVFSLQKKFFRSYVQVRKSFQIIFAMLILALLSSYLDSRAGISHFLLIAFPLSVFMAYYFLNASVRWFYESLYLILVGCIIYFQFS